VTGPWAGGSRRSARRQIAAAAPAGILSFDPATSSPVGERPRWGPTTRCAAPTTTGLAGCARRRARGDRRPRSPARRGRSLRARPDRARARGRAGGRRARGRARRPDTGSGESAWPAATRSAPPGPRRPPQRRPCAIGAQLLDVVEALAADELRFRQRDRQLAARDAAAAPLDRGSPALALPVRRRSSSTTQVRRASSPTQTRPA
jgi:hypothetical protein